MSVSERAAKGVHGCKRQGLCKTMDTLFPALCVPVLSWL